MKNKNLYFYGSGGSEVQGEGNGLGVWGGCSLNFQEVILSVMSSHQEGQNKQAPSPSSQHFN